MCYDVKKRYIFLYCSKGLYLIPCISNIDSMKKITIIICIFLGLYEYSFGQPYTLDARMANPPIIEGQLNMGNSGSTGKEIYVNNKYLTYGGKPIIPVMGEFHYSRYPRDRWKDILLKMKANGITIIATYVLPVSWVWEIKYRNIEDR